METTFEPSEGRPMHCTIATIRSYLADTASVSLEQGLHNLTGGANKDVITNWLFSDYDSYSVRDVFSFRQIWTLRHPVSIYLPD